ncbi:MAG: efflux RND transporter periplasmic adaptor subunit, partial [Oscillospiraceae bacterium]|nr:efflux RND transporter periplasmic adaptor subunit [Oscillospiraceae bacterium]
LGLINRFAGIVEPQGTWSVAKNSDVEVKEVFVEEGDEVEEGDDLFEYSILKYEEDLQQAEIDLERLENDYTATQEAIAQLEKEKRDASSSEQANYTIQIKEQGLTLKDKELDIEMKKAEIDKLEDNIDNAVVVSGISGIVKKINNGDSSGTGSDDNSFITVMKVGNYRIKGTVNEQNIGELTTGAAVLVHSRVNDRTWKGTITKIDTENAVNPQNSGYFYVSSEDTKSSKYPFYVELEDSEGLILGQHVYVEPDLGQDDEDNSPGVWLASYMVDQSDPDHPFVWKDAGGKLKKQQVTITDTMEEIGKVKISEGLELADSIAIPDGTLSEGMKTAPMSEKPDAGAAEGDEEYSGEESYEPQETGIEEGEFIEDTMPEVVPEGIGVEGIGVEGIGN